MEDESYAEITHQVDDSYFLALSNTEEEPFPISDEKYAVELQLQEVLMSVIIASRSHHMRPQPVETIKERGQSSSSTSSPPFCKICMDTASDAEMFHNNNCSHSFCRDCLSRYIGANVRENILMVKCPEVHCKGVLEPGLFKEIVPAAVFERWNDTLCESMILGSQRFYCPFKDCSALMLDDGVDTVTQAECPSCQRLFCAQCKVAWHSGLSCEKFERLGKNESGREDLMLREIAKNKGWKRCPKCRFYVEKTQGCMHITCRCGFEFCYGCGLQWGATHASCSG